MSVLANTHTRQPIEGFKASITNSLLLREIYPLLDTYTPSYRVLGAHALPENPRRLDWASPRARIACWSPNPHALGAAMRACTPRRIDGNHYDNAVCNVASGKRLRWPSGLLYQSAVLT